MLHPEINTEYRTNFQIESDDIGVGTPLERFYHNIRAIQLLNKLDAESRLATPTEQRVLAALRRACEGRTVLSVSHRIYENLGGRTIEVRAQA